MKVKVGTCGFPAAREKLFSSVDAVEIQQTFYHPPEEKTLKRWKEEAKGRVEFAVKAWQLITHPASSPTYKKLKGEMREKISSIAEKVGFFRFTKEVMRAYEETLLCCEAVEARILLFQTPSSFKQVEENIENLEKFFEKVNRPKGITFVWEPRGRWDMKVLREIADGCGLIIGGDPLGGGYLLGNLLYIRLHGIDGYKYRYTQEDFKNLGEMVGNKRGYVMFNNVNMFEDAVKFKKFLERRG